MLRLTSFPAYFTRFYQTIPYNRIAFLAGKVLQSSELDELQSQIYRDISSLSRLGSEKDGIFLTGGVSHVIGSNIELDRSTVYLDDMTIEIPKATLAVKDSIQRIGIHSKYEVITYTEDENLRDIAKGTANHNKPGSARIKTTSVWAEEPVGVLPNTESFYPVYVYEKGTLTAISDQSNEKVETLEFSVLRGLLVSYKDYLTSMSRTALNISEGRIKINSEILTLQNNSVLYLEGLTETTKITNEILLYDNRKIRHGLKNKGVSKIDTIAVLKKQEDRVIRSSTQNSSDPLSKPNVNKILSVTKGNVIYTEGSDFYRLSNSISWNLPGAEPAAQEEYLVVYEYLDYNLTVYPNADAESIDIPNNLGILNESKIYVSYTYFTPRKDTVYINNNGQVGYIKGSPSISNAVAPKVPASLGVKLAEVLLRYGQRPVIENTNIDVGTSRSLAAMSSELDDLRFKVEALTSSEQIRNAVRVPPRGLWSDPLLNNEKRSDENEQNAWTFGGTLQTSIRTTSIYPELKHINEAQYTVEETVLAQSFVSRSLGISNKTKQDLSQGLLQVNPVSRTFIPASISYLKESANSKSPVPFLWVEEDQYLPRIADLKKHPQRVNASFKIKANGYTPNETCDLYLGSEIVRTVVASNTGEILETEVVVPTSYMNGSYTARLVGRASGSSTKNNVDFNLTPIGDQKGIYSAFAGGVANSFYVLEDTNMSSCSIYLNNAGTKDIWIQVSEVEGGPNSSTALTYGKISASDTVAEWNTISLEKDLLLSRDRTYAIILYTEDPECRVGSIRKGDNSSTDTLRPECGMLWTSESGSSWSRYSDEQLAFKINSRKLQEAEYELATIDVSSCTHILVSSQMPMSEGSQLIFRLIDGSGERHEVTPSVISRIPFYTGRINISLVNKHKGKTSSIYPKEMQVMIGAYHSQAVYVSEEISVLTDVFKVSMREEVSNLNSLEVFARNSSNAWQPLKLEQVLQTEEGSNVRTVYSTENLGVKEGKTAVKIHIGLDSSGEPIQVQSLGAYSE